MTPAARTDRSTVTGSYDLMGVNGSVLPAPVGEGPKDAGEGACCRILAGELRLEENGSYRLALTARYEAGTRAAYTRVLESGGTWRFLASALDERSGEVTLVAADGPVTNAAVTRLSLVHRTRVPAAGAEGIGAELTWVYLRRPGAR